MSRVFFFVRPPSSTWRSRGDKSELEGVPEWILKDAVELALQAREGLERSSEFTGQMFPGIFAVFFCGMVSPLLRGCCQMLPEASLSL